MHIRGAEGLERRTLCDSNFKTQPPATHNPPPTTHNNPQPTLNRAMGVFALRVEQSVDPAARVRKIVKVPLSVTAWQDFFVSVDPPCATAVCRSVSD